MLGQILGSLLVQRKLAAILSADVVGYSGLMERDEAGTLDRLKAHRVAVFDPRVAAHGGRIFKLMGDGALVEFPSVVAAVACAVEIQAAGEAWNAGRAEGERIRYRVGVNLGDIIVEGDEIYGEGVNVAARLQALAEPGGVTLSRHVRDHVHGKVAAEFDDLGEHTVKNIERPIHVFAMRRSGSAPGAARVAESAGKAVSICVLPFANMSGDPEQEYFADGVTEDIITDLSKVSALFVVSRNTAFTLKRKQVEVSQVARQLKVTHVLEGSVRKAGGRVRITAQLIDGKTDGHVWAERYDRDLSDIFAVQDEISEAIVAALKLKLLPTERKAIEQRSTNNAEAYKLYLMARDFALRGSERHLAPIVRICQRAVEVDPSYARAWALLSTTQAALAARGMSDEDGGAAAARAIALDPNLSEGHAAMARVLYNAGRHEDSLKAAEQAVRLDPDSYHANIAAADACVSARRFSDAIRYYDKAAALNDSRPGGSSMTVQCYEAIGDTAAAETAARKTVERCERILEGEPDSVLALSHGVLQLARLREAERAKEWATRALLLDPDNKVMRYNLGCAMVRLGEHDAALEFFESVFLTEGAGSVAWAESDSDLDPLRDHPRYKELVAAAHARLAREARNEA
jgi:adenylate cyclase